LSEQEATLDLLVTAFICGTYVSTIALAGAYLTQFFYTYSMTTLGRAQHARELPEGSQQMVKMIVIVASKAT
jgi:hypothetical protein